MRVEQRAVVRWAQCCGERKKERDRDEVWFVFSFFLSLSLYTSSALSQCSLTTRALPPLLGLSEQQRHVAVGYRKLGALKDSRLGQIVHKAQLVELRCVGVAQGGDVRVDGRRRRHCARNGRGAKEGRRGVGEERRGRGTKEREETQEGTGEVQVRYR